MIRTLMKSLREYKKGSIITIMLSVLEAAFEIAIPLCMAEVIDKGIDVGDMSAVWSMVLFCSPLPGSSFAQAFYRHILLPGRQQAFLLV